MLHGYRSLLLGGISLALLSGCGSGSYGSTSGTATATLSAATGAGTGTTGTATTATGNVGFNGNRLRSGADDLVAATPSVGAVAVVIGASQTVSVTFASSDGLPMTGFGVSGTLGTLPTGWSGPTSFTCAVVSTGSNCVLNLTYAPPAADSGTLTLDYVVIDDSTMPRTDGSVTIAYVATTHNNVVAMAAPTGQIDAVVGTGNQSVSVNFSTDDGNAVTNFALTTDLSALPSGWTSTQAGLSCAIVSTGNGCQLALTYTPTAAAGGTLALSYSFTDDSGAAKTGTLNIPYFSASPNNVVATASPAGQIIAVQKTGGQAVPVTFTTDDGKPATRLYVTSDLNALPAGWKSASSSFSCSSVSTGNGCQLRLTYAPAALASGTLALRYAYTDDAGTAKTGVLNIAYAATTNDNVVGTASPAGQINAVVGSGSQAVAVTFTTDDGRPATALQLTNSLAALPSGWSSTVTSLTCSGLNVDNVCQLPLSYTPAVAGSGTLSLSYSYKNNAGESKTGTVNIAYRATTDDNIVGTPSQSSLAVRTGSSTNVTIAFTTDDGNPASALSVTSPLGALPAGWSSASNSFGCGTVSSGTGCMLSLTYAPTVADAGTLTLGFTYANDSGYVKTATVSVAYNAVTPYLYVVNANSNALSYCALNVDNSVSTCNTTGSGFDLPDGIALNGSYAYVTNTLGNSVFRCTLDAGGALSDCATAGVTLAAPTDIAINGNGTFAYVHQSTGLSVCAIAASDGSLSGCVPAGSGFDPLNGIELSADGTHAYAVHTTTNPGSPPTQTSVIDVCAIAPNGTLTSCSASAANTPLAVAAVALQNGALYVSTSAGSLYLCPINPDSSVGSCQTTATATNANGLAFMGTTAFVSSNSTTLSTCPVNADGTFGSCMPLNDPTFNGTAGMVVR
ncbi:MAG TPA: hypothetical protein VNR70_09035 [Steroidobacteraceae bacterium]|nr:hypothetical protein [Steroidobacteraceae bacterium]